MAEPSFSVRVRLSARELKLIINALTAAVVNRDPVVGGDSSEARDLAWNLTQLYTPRMQRAIAKAEGRSNG